MLSPYPKYGINPAKTIALPQKTAKSKGEPMRENQRGRRQRTSPLLSKRRGSQKKEEEIYKTQGSPGAGSGGGMKKGESQPNSGFINQAPGGRGTFATCRR